MFVSVFDLGFKERECSDVLLLKYTFNLRLCMGFVQTLMFPVKRAFRILNLEVSAISLISLSWRC